MMLQTSIETSFQEAVELVTEQHQWVNSLSLEKQLELYALYKVATIGPCNTSKPGWFDFRGQAKWEAWNKKGNMNPMDAMQEYIQLVDESLGSVGKSRKKEFAVSVSVFESNRETEIQDQDKTLFDWCSEGNLKELKRLLNQTSKNLIEIVNEEKYSLLHWACDREQFDIVEFLIQAGGSSLLNMVDDEGQTALHIAACIGNLPIARTLANKGIDVKIKNKDGCTAWQVLNEFHGNTLTDKDILKQWESILL